LTSAQKDEEFFRQIVISGAAEAGLAVTRATPVLSTATVRIRQDVSRTDERRLLMQLRKQLIGPPSLSYLILFYFVG
jgi:hypothetical protein